MHAGIVADHQHASHSFRNLAQHGQHAFRRCQIKLVQRLHDRRVVPWFQRRQGLAGAQRRGHQHHIRRQSQAAKHHAHGGGGVPPTGVQRARVIGQGGVVLRGFGVTEEKKLVHGVQPSVPWVGATCHGGRSIQDKCPPLPAPVSRNTAAPPFSFTKRAGRPSVLRRSCPQ